MKNKLIIGFLLLTILSTTAQESKKNNTNYDNMMENAIQCFENKDYKKSISILTAMSEKWPNDINIIENLGIVYINTPSDRPDFKQSLFYLRKAEQMFSANPEVYYNLACVYSVLKKTNEAVKTMQKAIDTGYTDIEWINNDQDMLNLRTSMWWKSIERNTSSIQQLLLRINDTETTKSLQYNDKIEYLLSLQKELNKYIPNDSCFNTSLLIQLSLAYKESNNTKKAIEYLERTLKTEIDVISESNPLVATIYESLGELYRTIDIDKSIYYYNHQLNIVSNINGNNSEEVAAIYNSLSLCYYEKESYETAIDNCKKELAIRLLISSEETEQVANCYYNIGNAQKFISDNENAINNYIKALTIKKNIKRDDTLGIAKILTELGSTYYDLKNYEQAIKNTTEALSLYENKLGLNTIEIAQICYSLGNYNVQTKNYSTAISYFERAISICERTNHLNNNDFAKYYNSLGSVYSDIKNYSKAIIAYKHALGISIQVYGEKSKEVADCYNEIGNAYEMSQNFNEALQCFQKEFIICSDIYGEESVKVANCLMSISTQYMFQGEFNSFLEISNKALAIFSKKNSLDDPIVPSLYISLGDIYRSIGDYEHATLYYTSGLSILEKSNNARSTDKARGNERIALVYSDKGDYDKAISFYEKAISIYKNDNTIPIYHLVQAYNDLGQTYLNLGKNNAAEDSYNNALSLCEKQQNIDTDEFKFPLLFTYIGKANVISLKGDKELALSYINKIKNIHFSISNMNFTGSIYSGLAFYANDDLDSALNEFISLTKNKFLSNSPRNQATIYSLIASIYKQKGNYETSQQYYYSALDIWSNSISYQEVINNTWTICNQNKDINTELALKAISCGINAVEKARLDLSSAKTNIMSKSLPLYYAGIDLEVHKGNVVQAFEYSELLRSRGFLDQMGTEYALRLNGITDDERIKVHTLIRNIDLSRNELERLNKITYENRDTVAITTAGTNLANFEQELLLLDKTIGDRIPKYKSLRNPKPINLDSAQKWCKQNQVILEYVLWDSSLEDSMNSQKQSDDPLTISKMQQKNDITNINSYCLIVTQNEIKAVKLDSDYDYTSSINKLRNIILRRWSEPKMESLRNELYNKLIKPISDNIPKDTKDIVIVPDGPIAFLPIDILRENPTSKDFGSTYSITLSPSISVSVLSSENSTNNNDTTLALGGSVYSQRKDTSTRGGDNRGYTRIGDSQNTQFDSLEEYRGLNVIQIENTKKEFTEKGAGAYFASRGFQWNDLPGTMTEVNNLRDQAFIKKSFTILAGKNASETKIKQLSNNGELSKYSIIHLACHGYFDSMIPNMSSVVLSEVSGNVPNTNEDGYLTVPEIALLNINARIINLSACETGLAQIKRGDGMIGLTRSFLVAGAKNVGVSLWSVDDAATSEFMTRLYKKVMQNGMNFNEAYNSVKNEFRQDSNWSHPYYWAAFTLYE